MTTGPKYVEPTGNDRAGWRQEGESGGKSFTVRLPTAWERFQKEEGIPIFKGIGVKDARDLPRADWPRVGGKGSYIQLIGTNNENSIFVVEIPPRGELKPQRHMYEEKYLVVEGRGSTEVWKNGDTATTAFEWAPWSMFSIPLNANFRIINSSSSPAILLAASTAPRIINTFQNPDFVFGCEFNFDDRFGGNLEDYWKVNEELEPQPIRGRAMVTSNLIPDVAKTYLPLDNNRGPGFRWVAPNQSRNTTLQGWIGEYPSGRYAKAHFHSAGAVLVCVRGKGYSYTWPKDICGETPWVNGKEEFVKMQEYGPGGMVSAAPGPANWFHQHFAYGKDPFRVVLFNGGVPGNPVERGSGSSNNIFNESAEVGAFSQAHAEISEGGNALAYHRQDPHIREYFEQKLAEEGAVSTMPPEVYTESGAHIDVMSD